MNDLGRASARSVVWNLVQNVVARSLSLIVVAVLSRLIDRAAFGSVALALAITSFAELLVNQGYGEYVTQSQDPSPQHLSTAFWSNMVFAGALAAGLVAFAHPLAVAFDAPGATAVVQLLALSIVVRASTVVPSGLMMRELRFRELSRRSVIASILGGGAGIAAAFSGLGVYSLVIQVLVAEMASAVAVWLAVGWRPTRDLSRAAFAELSRFGLPLIAAALVGLLSRRVDTMIVGGALGVVALGLYSLAQRIFQIALQVINKSSVEVIFSALARLATTPERRLAAFHRVIELTAILCFPVYVGLALVASDVVTLVFGPAWVDAAPVLVGFAISGVPHSLSLVHMATFKSTATTRLLLLSNLALLLVYLPLVVVLIEMGEIGAAYAMAISSAVVIPIELYLLSKVIAIDVARYAATISRALASSVVMGGAIWTVRSQLEVLHPLASLLVCVTLGVAVYTVAVRVLAPTTFRDTVTLLRRFIRRSPGPLLD